MTQEKDNIYFRQKAENFLAHALIYTAAWRNGHKAVDIKIPHDSGRMACAKFHIPLGDVRMLISDPENGRVYRRGDTLPGPETVARLVKQRLQEYGLANPKITNVKLSGKALLMQCEVPAQSLHECYIKDYKDQHQGKGR